MPLVISSFRKKLILCASLLAIFLGIYISKNVVFISSIGGYELIYNPLLVKLYKSSCFQRLRHIDQSGPVAYFRNLVPPFTRFDHSIGVWQLLKKQHRNLKEQAAGLLHDTSHTAFSHLADYLFTQNYQKYAENGYQDSIHMSYLKQQKINLSTLFHHIDISDLDPEKTEYKALEQPSPDLCADRIEYNLHTALLMGLLTRADVKAIIHNLKFDGENWYFTNISLAKKFSCLPLYFTQNFWASKWNVFINIHFAKAVRRLINLGILSEKDMFKTDSFIMEKVKNQLQDPIVKTYWDQCDHYDQKQPHLSYQTIKIQPKFRGVNPFVKIQGNLVRLTELDVLFKNYFECVQDWCQKGYELDIIDDKSIHYQNN